MIDYRPVVITEDNLSVAWGRAFLAAMDLPAHDLSPFVITVTGFNENLPLEDSAIRNALSKKLVDEDKYSIDVSAMTIFPYKTWIRRKRPDHRLFYRHALDKLLPWLQAQDRHNCFGTYFSRMMNYVGIAKGEQKTVNQLEFLVDLWNDRKKKGRRPKRSDLQLSILDPAQDHTGSALRGFPCLQQVSFGYDSEGLSLAAYYPTQYLFDRAYGNYLGLCHLAHFFAHETSNVIRRATFFVSHPELGSNKAKRAIAKSSLVPLANSVRDRISTLDTEAEGTRK